VEEVFGAEGAGEGVFDLEAFEAVVEGVDCIEICDVCVAEQAYLGEIIEGYRQRRGGSRCQFLA
jgi:hypothetical protein